MKIYRILSNSYFGGEILLPDNTVGIPYGTTRTPVPEIPDGKFAIWNGRGWSITEISPNDVPVENPPVQKVILVSEFFDSFEDQKFNVLSSQDPLIRALILDCSVRQNIDLEDSNIVQMVNYIFQIGIPINVNKVLRIEE
jgi:hypothetical protein